MSQNLIRAVEKALREVADETRAPEMQRYMKSTMPYLGVSKPDRAAALKPIFANYTFDDPETWMDAVRSLWDSAKYREERYAALDLTGQSRYRKWHSIEVLPVYEHIILTGAWWDYVDTVAGGRFIYIYTHDAKAMTSRIRKWSKRKDSFWIRRAAILSQIKRKEATDRELLTDCIVPSMADREFFIRKAIGWALRSFAYTDPEWVRRFVRAHEAELSPLSKREALRLIGG